MKRISPRGPVEKESKLQMRMTDGQKHYLLKEAAKKRLTLSSLVEECIVKAMKIEYSQWDIL